MRIIKNLLKSELNIRTEKDFPIKDIEFIDITPLILQKDVLKEIIEKFVEELSNKEIDYIVIPEARGFLFGTAIAKELNIGCIPVRKEGKLPPTTVEKQFEYEKEYGKDTLELPKLVNEEYKGKKFYIIDDFASFSQPHSEVFLSSNCSSFLCYKNEVINFYSNLLSILFG